MPQSPDPDGRSGALLLEVVIRDRRHRVLEDFRILALALRKPAVDQQDRPDDQQRDAPGLRIDCGLVRIHDEPLRHARDRRPCHAEEPSEVPPRKEAHLTLLEHVHVFAPLRLRYRPYHHMIPMNTNPITIWAARLATAQ